MYRISPQNPALYRLGDVLLVVCMTSSRFCERFIVTFGGIIGDPMISPLGRSPMGMLVV